MIAVVVLARGDLTSALRDKKAGNFIVDPSVDGHLAVGQINYPVRGRGAGDAGDEPTVKILFGDRVCAWRHDETLGIGIAIAVIYGAVIQHKRNSPES